MHGAKLGAFWDPIASVPLSVLFVAAGLTIEADLANALYDCVMQGKKRIEATENHSKWGWPHSLNIYAISCKTNARMSMLAIASFTTSNVWLIVSYELWVKNTEINLPVLFVYSVLMAFGLTAYYRISKAISTSCDKSNNDTSS